MNEEKLHETAEEVKETPIAETESCCDDHATQSLQSEVESLKEQLAAAKNDYFKAFADAENRKKRLQMDYDVNMKYRIQSFVLDILPAIDNFERALAQEITDEATKAYARGYEMIYEQFMSALHKEGVEAIETKDQPFDPNFHHAIMVEKVDGVKEGMILQELQKGYKLKDRVIRASMVKVSE